MSRTQSRYDCDTGYGDGVIPFAPKDFMPIGTTVFTENASGDISWNQAASQTVTYLASLSTILYRLGLLDQTYEQFGSSSAGPGTTPAGVSGPPPYKTSSGKPIWLNPVTTNRPKGITFLDFTLAYLIGGAALTTHTIGLTSSLFKNNTAISVATIITNAANGLATATQTLPYVTKVSVAAASQVYEIADLTNYMLELDVATQTAGTYRMYGGWLHVMYNYN